MLGLPSYLATIDWPNNRRRDAGAVDGVSRRLRGHVLVLDDVVNCLQYQQQVAVVAAGRAQNFTAGEHGQHLQKKWQDQNATVSIAAKWANLQQPDSTAHAEALDVCADGCGEGGREKEPQQGA